MTQEQAFIDIHAVVEITSLSRASVYRLTAEGEFPKAIQITKRRVVWDREAILSWMNERIATPKSAARPHPNAFHREVCEAVMSLELGTYQVVVQSGLDAPVKAEGGLLVDLPDGRRLCVVPGVA